MTFQAPLPVLTVPDQLHQLELQCEQQLAALEALMIVSVVKGWRQGFHISVLTSSLESPAADPLLREHTDARTVFTDTI